MTNENRNTATPNLAQRTIERVSMTNDKDSEVLIELREAIREAGVKRTTTRLYAAVMAFDATWNARQPTQSDALAPIGTEGKYVHDDLELSCRVTAHIEGWLEVEFLLDRSSAIIRPSRFIPLQEQSK